MNRLLGIGGSRAADLNLLIQLAMAALLTAGMFLARAKRFRAHAWTQSLVLVLNLGPIAAFMAPSFRRQVLPHVPAKWHEAYYAVATLHAAAGTFAELLGLYVVLAAGTQVLPAALRFKNYKAWMRTTLSVWWGVVLLGAGVYYVWYVEPGPATPRAGQQQTTAAAAAPVTVRNFEFEPRALTVQVGTTVRWTDVRGRHRLEADDKSFESPILLSGARFQQTFDKPGTYQYYCMFHGDPGGKDMAGRIIVK